MYAIGLVFFAIGIYLLCAMKKKRKRCTKRVYGTLDDFRVEIHKRTQDRNDHDRPHGTTTEQVHFPIYRYTVNGVEYVEEATSSANPYRWKIKKGDRVAVYYTPDNPKDFYVSEQTNDLQGAIIFICVGIIIMLFPTITLLM